MSALSEVPLPFARPTLHIAIAQIFGPQPDGKQVCVVDGRETFAWSKISDIHARIAKAERILSHLSEKHDAIDLVVFPEYSLPLDKHSVQTLSNACRRTNMTIIAGSDNIVDPNSAAILNQCAVFVPGREHPVWIPKRELSQWEVSFIDKPKPAAEPSPIFTWSAEGTSYWLSVHICLDMTNIIADPRQSRGEAGMYILPMCSPEMPMFKAYSDVLLRSEAGRAIVLCNAVGDLGIGASALMAVVPGGKTLRPALELHEFKEGLAVFELDFTQLAPPRKSTKNTKSPLKRPHFYELRPDGAITPVKNNSPDSKIRAVVNPALYAQLGKMVRLAFLSTDKYADLPRSAGGKDFEVLVLLGQHDVLVTHLHQSMLSLVYDISEAVSWRSGNNTFVGNGKSETSQELSDAVPYFQVSRFYKVLGVTVPSEAAAAFSSAHHSVPTSDEVVQILALAEDWHDPSVSEQARQKFQERRWILGETATQPGAINAVMAITLTHYGADLAVPLRTFEEVVMPKLVNNAHITSIYGGTGFRLSAHFVLRISSSIDALFALIDGVHDFAADARLLISTSSYVVIKKLSDLDLRAACLMPTLPPEEDNYRQLHLFPLLDAEYRLRFSSLPRERQLDVIREYRRLESGLDAVQDRSSSDDWVVFRRKLVLGLIRSDLQILAEPFTSIQARVEQTLIEIIDQTVTDSQFNAWKQDLSIQSHRTKREIGFADRIKVVAKATAAGDLKPEMLGHTNNLLNTNLVRNAFAHQELQRINIAAYVEAMTSYCDFLSAWRRIED